MATRTITTIPRKYFLPNNSVVSYQFPYWTNLLVNYFVCSTAIKAATKLHNKRVRWRVYGTQRRNAQSCGQNTAELSASVFPSAEDLQGMNSRDESYTVYTPRGWKKRDEHAREAWQINWESETTRDTATETTLQSKFNYLPTPYPRITVRKSYAIRMDGTIFVIETDSSPSKDQEKNDNCLIRRKFWMISEDCPRVCKIGYAKVIYSIFMWLKKIKKEER